MILTKLTVTKMVCFVFMVCLAFVYFHKKRKYNINNKYFSGLINLNIFGIIVHFFAEYASYYYTPVISEIVFKVILFYYLFYTTYFLNFILDAIEIKKKEKLIKISNVVCIICCIISIFLPSHLYRDVANTIFYTNGLDTKVVVIHGLISFVILLVILIVKFKTLDKKRKFYILFFLIGLEVASIIQNLIPELAITVYMESVLCNIMYYTIENPDVEADVYMAAKSQALKAGRAKDDFLSSMSHELRTPLNAIVGLSQLIEQETEKDTIKEDAKEIVVASQDLLELIESILNVNKIENNTLDLIEENYDLNSIINELNKMINLRVVDKEVEFTTNISNELPKTLYGDKEKIRTIITNLLSNAIKYTDKGKVELDVSCINKNDISKLEIIVKDTGRGMSKEQVDNLYTKFYRREEDKDSDIKGVGLGLAITKSLVDLMEGTIKVDSEENVGSTFTVTINQKIIEQNNIEVL
ncbi:MAG: ATP-binding protein [Bacilli bacterium]|nr:ATP-binding protein [Bacilli bacterium]